MKQYDTVMIGFGKGAKTLAAELASNGKRVAVVERSPRMYGGTCPNVGCIPTKFLVSSAEKVECLGFKTWEEKQRYYANTMAEKERLTATLRKANYEKLVGLGVDVLTGEAKFVSPKEIEVKTAEGVERVSGARFVLDTGSEAVLPPIAGLSGNPFVYTSERMMELHTLPKELVVVGGGYIGLEFASFYAAFGSRVTVLTNTEAFLPREDADVAAAIYDTLEKRGIRLVLAADVQEIARAEGRAEVRGSAQGQPFAYGADAVLVATGRKPNTAALNLAAAGIETAAGGAVRTDELLRTSAPGVWAIGDVKGGLQFTYISLDDYRILRAQFLPGYAPRSTEDRGAVPFSVFIRPAFSRVGLTEREARAQGYDVLTAAVPAGANPKAKLLKETDGLLKAVADKKTGRILGAALFAAESYESINVVKLAMDAGLPYTALRDMIFTHPTMSEALNDLFGAMR